MTGDKGMLEKQWFIFLEKFKQAKADQQNTDIIDPDPPKLEFK